MPYRHDTRPPRSDEEAQALCGGWNLPEVERYWDANADKHSTPLIVGDDKPLKENRLWVPMQKLGERFSSTISQPTGDCFVASTMILMADGTEKRIQDVVEGDEVISHHNKVRKVVKAFVRPYTGPIVTIKAKSMHRDVTSTEDHKFVTYPELQFDKQNYGKADRSEAWEEVGKLTTNDRVKVPFGIPSPDSYETLDTSAYNTFWNPGTVTAGCVQDADNERGKEHTVKHKIPEEIQVNEGFGQLLGLYLAEGSQENGRVRFSFSAEEEHTHVATTQSLLKTIFGLDSSWVHRHENKSCIVISCYSGALANLMKDLAPGNVYSKTVPAIIQRAPVTVRKACLLGWMDGDGHLRESHYGAAYKSQGTTVSPHLATDMARLALSCGLSPSHCVRTQAEHQNAPAHDVMFSSDDTFELYPELTDTRTRAPKLRVKHVEGGLALQIESTKRTNMRHGLVYCIEVEEDHSFIANGYAVHNCVSRGFEHGLEVLQASMIVVDGKNLKWTDVYPPYHYATGRVLIGQNRLRGGAGSLGGWQAQSLEKYGSLPATLDLPVYNARNVNAWGDGKSADGKRFEDYIEQAQKSLLRSSARVQTMDQLFMMLSNYYPVTICSNRGYAMKPDNQGFHRAQGNWAHCMCVVGFSIEEGWIAIANSWGDIHGKVSCDHGVWPPGYLKVHIEEFERLHLRGSESIALSAYDGWPERRYGLIDSIPTY